MPTLPANRRRRVTLRHWNVIVSRQWSERHDERHGERVLCRSDTPLIDTDLIATELIDTDHGIVVDMDASRSNKTAEGGATRKMLDRSQTRFGAKPGWIARQCTGTRVQ